MSAASLPKVSFSTYDQPKNNFNSDKKLYNFQRNDNNLSNNNKSSNNFSSKLFKSGDTRPARSLPPLNNSNGGASGSMGGVVPQPVLADSNILGNSIGSVVFSLQDTMQKNNSGTKKQASGLPPKNPKLQPIEGGGSVKSILKKPPLINDSQQELEKPPQLAHQLSFSNNEGFNPQKVDDFMSKLRHYSNTPIAQSRSLINQVQKNQMMEEKHDFSDEVQNHRGHMFNFKSLIAERKMFTPENNESFDVEATFKKIMKDKADKTNNMIAQVTKPPVFSAMVQLAQKVIVDRPKVPEPHEIKSFKDVVSLYQEKSNGVTDPYKLPEFGNPDDDSTKPAFYTFQRRHPAFDSHTLKKFEEEVQLNWREPDAEDDPQVPLYQQEPDKRTGVPESPTKDRGGVGNFAEVKIQTFLKKSDFFQQDAEKIKEDAVQLTKSTFIKYCVNLFKTNIAPMLQKMKRANNDDAQQDNNNELDTKKKGQQVVDFAQGANLFITKLDVMKKQHKRELIKINILHQRDIDAEKLSKEEQNDPNKMIMEEMKYYDNLDLEKLEDDKQRAEREKKEQLQKHKQLMQENAPLRFKMKIGFQRLMRHQKKQDIFEKLGYQIQL